MEATPSSTVTRGYKHRLNQLFAPDACQRIGCAVQYVHSIMCNATLLVKYRVTKRALASVDHNVAPVIVDEKEVWNAIRAVQTKTSSTPEDTTSTSSTARRSSSSRDAPGPSTRMKKRHRETDEKKENEEKMDNKEKKRRKNGDIKRKSPEEEEKIAREELQRQWMSDNAEMTSRCLAPVTLHDRGRDLSVSHILGIATKQYAAAVISNVRYHYRSYVCCALGIVLRRRFPYKMPTVTPASVSGAPKRLTAFRRPQREDGVESSERRMKTSSATATATTWRVTLSSVPSSSATEHASSLPCLSTGEASIAT